MAANCGKKKITGKEAQKSTGDLPKRQAELQLTERTAASTNNQPAVSQKRVLPVPPAKQKPDSPHFGISNEIKHGHLRRG